MDSLNKMTLDELRAAPELKASGGYIEVGVVVPLPREDGVVQEDSGYPCMHLVVAEPDGKVWLYKPEHVDVLSMIGGMFAIDILHTSKLAAVYRLGSQYMKMSVTPYLSDVDLSPAEG